MTRGATLFSGGGGCEARLTDIIDFRHAVEYDAQIAAVYAQNIGAHVQVARVEDVDYSLWGALDYLHASPVCKEYSAAKAGGAEGEGDIQSALAVVRALEATQPRVFTLENVGAYQHGQAYRRIVQWLNANGYMWHAEVLNSADFGVPQTRRRLILRAVRDALLPTLPSAVPWVGWYAAIEDLIPTLPESQFAAWQLARLPGEISGDILMMTGNTSFSYQCKPGVGVCERHEPANSVYASSSSPRAFIIGSQNAGQEYSDGIRYGDVPAMTMTAAQKPRAWLVGEDSKMGMVADDQPSMTLVSSHRSGNTRAWLSAGRVVKMTPRALARFQSFPDSYVLPDRASLACTVIGNAVASLMMRRIVEQLI